MPDLQNPPTEMQRPAAGYRRNADLFAVAGVTALIAALISGTLAGVHTPAMVPAVLVGSLAAAGISFRLLSERKVVR